jgi:hypothetical protein
MNRIQTDANAARDVDVRGFTYTLEPVRQKQQWRLDRLMAELARTQQALATTEAQMEELRRTHEAQARAVGHAQTQRIDPAAHRHALNYLAGLCERTRELDEERKLLVQSCDSLREACVAHQLRIEGLVRHKEEALAEYAHEMRLRASAEQDRDWLARSATGRVAGGRGQ